MARYRDNIATVAAVGGGVIGGGWVAAFLGNGRSVRLFDPAQGAAERARAHAAAAWPQMVELGLASRSDAWEHRLSFHATLEEAVAEADFVQESAPERPEEKRALFAELDGLVPRDVVIASSTSSLPISELQAGLEGAARFVLGHPFNPVHLIPLVEMGGGGDSDVEAIDLAENLYISMGKRPIRLKREIFGHVANRLTSAMFREAVRLVAEGYASVEDIDRAIAHGPALKWAVQGQFTTFHTSGGDGGLGAFLPKFSPGIMQRWSTMTDPPLGDPDLQAELISQMNAAAGGKSVAEIAEHQDAAVMGILKLLRDIDTDRCR